MTDSIEAFDSLLNKLEEVEDNFNYLRTYLITQLSNYEIENLDNYTFKEIIDTINEINAIETQNENNIKPQTEPQITDAEDILDYIGKLYQRIRYYMKLLSYYLILKSVPEEKVKRQTTLEGLISLISLIQSKKASTISISDIEETHFYSKTVLDYILKGDDDNLIKEGTITLKINNTEYCSINAGEELSFIPDFYTNEPVSIKIEYSGTDNYMPCELSKNINILSSDIILNLFVSNINTDSSYYSDKNIGYEDDTFNIIIKAYNAQNHILPNIPLSLCLNNFSNEINTFDLSDGDYINLYTDDTGTCIVNCTMNVKKENNEAQNQLIKIKSNYENTQALNNASNEHEVMIYYNPLYQVQDKYEEYYGEENYQYEILRKNIYTGTCPDNLYDGQDIKVSFDGMPTQLIRITDGKAVFNIQSLSVGNHILTWELNGTKKKTKIKILSHFILPDKNSFYYPQVPNIYYAPFYSKCYNTDNWEPIENKEVIINSYYYDSENQIQNIDINKTIYTNEDGILNDIWRYNDLYNYKINLMANSDNLNETISYTYEILKPFAIELKTYNEKIKIEYDIYIYDIENYNLGDYDNCISLINNENDIKNLCHITDELVNNDYYIIHIVIPSKYGTYGDTSLIIDFNGYEEFIDFTLIENIITFISDIEICEGELCISSEEDNPLERELLYDITIDDNGDLEGRKKIIEDINDVIVNVDINENGDIIYQCYGEN